jgi:acetyltransferase-like isoleucine patch superfamily enzyme
MNPLILKNPSTYEDDRGNKIICTIPLGENVLVEIRNGYNNTLIVAPGAIYSNLRILFDCNNAICELGVNSFKGIIRLGEKCLVRIGNRVTCTASCYISTAEGSSVVIGEDCMFASRNEIRSDDGHPIFSVKSGLRVNMPKSISIGSHVWLGAGASVLGGATIGDGSVIGYNSVVTGRCVIPNNCIAVGQPARVIRNDIAWERPHLNLSKPFIKPDINHITCSKWWQDTENGADTESLFGKYPYSK